MKSDVSVVHASTPIIFPSEETVVHQPNVVTPVVEPVVHSNVVPVMEPAVAPVVSTVASVVASIAPVVSSVVAPVVPVVEPIVAVSNVSSSSNVLSHEQREHAEVSDSIVAPVNHHPVPVASRVASQYQVAVKLEQPVKAPRKVAEPVKSVAQPAKSVVSQQVAQSELLNFAIWIILGS